MKLNKIIIAGLCLAAMASCQKENAVSDNVKNFSFTVVSELPQGDGSKAAIVNNKPVFQAGDEITVWDGTTNNKFTTAEGGSSATFNGTAADGAAAYTVISPYQENLEINGSVITYEIPSVQVATKGSCDPKALFSAGKVTKLDGGVTLHNMSGFVKVTVPEGLQVKEIQIGGGQVVNNAICGKFTYNVNDNRVTGLVSGTTSEVIYLVPPAGQSLIEAGDYYIAMRVKDDYPGLVAAYVNADNKLCKRTTTKTIKLELNHILPLGELDATNYVPVEGKSALRMANDDPQFTGLVKKISGMGSTSADVNTTIKKVVVRAHSLLPAWVKNATNGATVVSAGNLSAQGYTLQSLAYFKDGVVYVLSEASTIDFNASSTRLFKNFQGLEEVSFNACGSCANCAMDYMFDGCTSLKSVDFGDCDFSKVANMSFMFLNINTLEVARFGKTSTEKVTNLKAMFSGCKNMTELNLGPNFTITHLADKTMCNNMFADTAKDSNTAAGSDPTKKCHLYMSQAEYDQCRQDKDGSCKNSALNPARFYFVPVTE